VIDVSMGAVTYGAVLKTAATGGRLAPGAALRPDGTVTRDPADVISGSAGIAPLGADQSYKGFALALLVETLCSALAGLEGHSAVVLLARQAADPMPGLLSGLEGRHVPGEGGLERLRASRAAGTVDLPDDLWAWLQPGG
jgi:LDH2 family malate/lactate/ureidoglycolate dehydrogenase